MLFPPKKSYLSRLNKIRSFYSHYCNHLAINLSSWGCYMVLLCLSILTCKWYHFSACIGSQELTYEISWMAPGNWQILYKNHLLLWPVCLLTNNHNYSSRHLLVQFSTLDGDTKMKLISSKVSPLSKITTINKIQAQLTINKKYCWMMMNLK